MWNISRKTRRLFVRRVFFSRWSTKRFSPISIMEMLSEWCIYSYLILKLRSSILISPSIWFYTCYWGCETNEINVWNEGEAPHIPEQLNTRRTESSSYSHSVCCESRAIRAGLLTKCRPTGLYLMFLLPELAIDFKLRSLIFMWLMYKNSFHASQRIVYISISYINQLELYRGITVVYCKNHIKHTYSLGKLINVTVSDNR
jgi:hypothetical protein